MSEFESLYVPNSYGLVPHLNKKLSKLLFGWLSKLFIIQPHTQKNEEVVTNTSTRVGHDTRSIS